KSVKQAILVFKTEIQDLQATNAVQSEDDVIATFAQLLMTPIEQFQQLLGDFTSRLRALTLFPQIAAKPLLSSLEPQFDYEIRELEIDGRKIKYFGTSYVHKTVLILLSPIGGKIEDLYPMFSSLLGKYQLFVLGQRGFDTVSDQILEYRLQDYVKDLKDFLEFVGSDKNIILGAHSLFSAIIFEEFLEKKYTNISKFILISGIHRAPDNFRKGVKALPPIRMWSPIKGHIRKIAPKILFSRDANKEIIETFIQNAFKYPDRVYYEIFKDFLPGFEYTKKLQSLTKPLLVIWGNNDRLITDDLKTEMIECVPPNLLKYKELPGGHMVLLEEINEVGREIHKFTTANWSQIKIE
ncbi:MAG: alpha/beta fold hydrolase, partial [Candidatus Hodarchaeales archaeon]